MYRYDIVGDSIIGDIKSVLGSRSYEYYKAYNGRSLEILSKYENNQTRIYIRILYNGFNYKCEIANIDLDEKIRRRGVFTKIVKQLECNNNISEIWVSSVLSEEMHRACKKLQMLWDDTILGYKIIK